MAAGIDPPDTRYYRLMRRRPGHLALQGLSAALSAHLEPFSRFFRSLTRDATAPGYMHGLFQSERPSMWRMNEINAVDHQSMQHHILVIRKDLN